MDQLYSWLHYIFKDISDNTSHAQIRVTMKKLWHQQVGEEKQVVEQKLFHDISRFCRDKASNKAIKLFCDKPRLCHNKARRQFFFFLSQQSFSIETVFLSRQIFSVATKFFYRDKVFFVATKFFCCNKVFMSRQSFLYVATLTLGLTKMPRKLTVFKPISPKDYKYSFFFRFLGPRGGGRTSLMGFLSLNCPFFSCRFSFSVDLRVVLEQIFICIKEISVLYIKDSDFITVQTKIQTKIWIFLSLLVS